MGIWTIIGLVFLGSIYLLLSIGVYTIAKEQARYIYPPNAIRRKTMLLVFTSAISPPFVVLSVVSLFPFFLAMGLAKLVGLYW